MLRDFLKKVPMLATSVRGIREFRGRLALAAAKRKVPQDDGYLRSVYGVWLKDRWHDSTYRYCVLGEYGYFYSRWIGEQEDCIFLDIGANVGLYSLIACQNPGIKAAYAFEPVPETFGFLVDNLKRNGADKCKACPVGISSATAELSIKTKKGHSGVSTLRDNAVDQAGFDSVTRIKVVGPDYLDDVVDIGQASKIIVKIDVEGHEQVVIDALMQSKLWPKIWNIYYEVNERYLDHQAVLSKLQAAGFEITNKNGDELGYDLMVQRKSIG